MDDLVQQAMAKWPNVPDCYGWLGLDARGDWYMRDDQTQAQGTFAQSKGSRLQHDKLIAFIGRNYDCDKQGLWFFQNGPQRVYIELEVAPYIWRLSERFEVTAHTGQTTQVLACLVDEDGRVYLQTTGGFGLVHTLDVGWVAEAIEKGLWVPEDCLSQELPKRFGFVISPQQGDDGKGMNRA